MTFCRSFVLPRLLIGGLIMGASVTPSQADQLDTVQPYIAGSIIYDDNVFRVSPEVNPAAEGVTKGKSDAALATQVGLKLDKSWSLQHVVLDASLSDVHYRDYGYLSYTSTAYDASWMWQFTPHVSGTIAASQSNSLANYADYRHVGQRDVITVDNRNFDLDWDIASGWHALAGLVQSDYSNSVPFVQQTSSRLDSSQIGAKYVAPSGNWVDLLVRQGHGSNPDQALDYVNLQDNAFQQRDVEMNVNWQLSGKSVFTATLADRNHQDAHFSQRNFSGLVGNLTYVWNPTGKLQLTVLGSRDLVTYVDQVFPYYTSSYAATDTLSLNAVWSLSANTQLKAGVSDVRRSFEGELFPVYVRRVDTPRQLTLGADWAPWRTVKVRALLPHENRGSTIPGYDYDDNMLTVSGQWLF